jgi:WD40 repeat protein/tRNA A-37 threonylcarbamoyl transferase component Bud32
MSPLDCPTQDQLSAFHLGELPEPDLTRVAEHLEQCPNCDRALRSLEGGSDLLVRRLRRSGSDTPRAGGAGPAAEGPAMPERVGDYEILEELGRGGMSVVYKARHRGLGRLAAVKMLRPDDFADPERRTRFRREAEAAAGLHHPGVVQLFEAGEWDGVAGRPRPYLALEYVGGGSLAQRLAERPPTPRQAAAWVEQAARAVAYAHGRGVIHRDLKPSNLLLGEDGAVKVCDFGIAKVLAAPGLTATDQVMGTPEYMAPEQAAAGPAGPAADLYALGAVLYALLTGRPPFRAATGLGTLAEARERDPVRPRLLRPEAPRDLETICLKCLEKDPRRRYAGAAELADDLRRFLDGEPVRARAVGPAGRALRWARRRPGTAGLLLGLLATAAAGLGLVLWQWGEALRQRGLAEQRALGEAEARHEADRARGALDGQLSRARVVGYAVQIALAQSELRGGNVLRAEAVLSGCDRSLRGWEHAYLTAQCRRLGRVLGRHDQGGVAVAFSPRGGRVASAGDGVVQVWDVDSGRLLHTLRGSPDKITGLAFHPDGRRLASGAAGKAVVWDVETGQALQTLAAPDALTWVENLAFSPDGERLASSSFGGDLRVWDLGTGREALSWKGHAVQVAALAWSPDGRTLASTAGDRTVRLWDAAGGRPERVWTRPRWLWAAGLAWGPDGARLAVADSQGEVHVVEAKTGQDVLVVKGPLGMTGVAWSHDGGLLATTGVDGAVRLWDAQTGRPFLCVTGHAPQMGVRALFGPDGRLASAGREGAVRLWDLTPGREAVVLGEESGTYAVAAAYSPDGRLLAGSATDRTAPLLDPRTGGVVYLWDVRTRRVQAALKGHVGPVGCLAFRPDGRQLASGGLDRTVRLWDVERAGEAAVLKGHRNEVVGAAYSPDGRLLASTSTDGTARLWDPATGTEVRRLEAGAPLLAPPSFSPDGRLLASADNKGAVKLWEVGTGAEVRAPPRQPAKVRGAAFDPASGRLALIGDDGTVRLWDPDAGEEVWCGGADGSASALTWAPDGRRLATAHLDGRVHVWDPATGQRLFAFEAHGMGVRRLVFSRDGRLATVGVEGLVKLWEAEKPGD